MATEVKRFEVGDTSPCDETSGVQTLDIGCPNRIIISLVFETATHNQVHELDRLLKHMGFTAVEVRTYADLLGRRIKKAGRAGPASL
jgi:hypothetical protein